MTKNRAILIDAVNRIIKEVEIDSGIQDIYKNIGCDLFAVAGNFNEDPENNLLDSTTNTGEYSTVRCIKN